MNDRSQDSTLDRALTDLPVPDVDPLWSRATRLAAERRLAGSRAPSRTARYEPMLLVALSVLQLLWAALRVIAVVR